MINFVEMGYIDIYRDKIASLYSEHLVEKLYVFGSTSKNSLTDRSNIDLVVKFKTVDLFDYFNNYMSFKNKLVKLFHRDLDLFEEQTTPNPFVKKSIEESKQLIYG